MNLRLRILAGQQLGTLLLFKESMIVETGGLVGRDAHKFLRLPDPSVSLQHAQFGCDQKGVWVKDLGSTNGTSLDSRPLGVTPTYLPPHGMLCFGGVNVEFWLERHRSAAPPEMIPIRSNEPSSPTQRAPETVVSGLRLKGNTAVGPLPENQNLVKQRAAPSPAAPVANIPLPPEDRRDESSQQVHQLELLLQTNQKNLQDSRDQSQRLEKQLQQALAELERAKSQNDYWRQEMERKSSGFAPGQTFTTKEDFAYKLNQSQSFLEEFAIRLTALEAALNAGNIAQAQEEQRALDIAKADLHYVLFQCLQLLL